MISTPDFLQPTAKWAILPYDIKRFPFAKILQRDVYPVPQLDQLHRYVLARRHAKGSILPLSTKDNLVMRKMMQAMTDDSDFYRLYHLFMKIFLAPFIGQTISYSAHPKMRIHFPGTGSISSFHYDVPITCRPDQINFWMPFTDVSESTTIWIESDYGRADYQPVPVRYGEVLIFDGGYIGHGSVRNVSDTTRISLDMRFALKTKKERSSSIALMNLVIERCQHISTTLN